MVQCETCTERRQVTESGSGVFPVALLQIIRQGLRPVRIPCQGECKSGAVLHIQLRGHVECSRRALPCLSRIPEKGCPQCRWSFVQSRPFPLGRLHSKSPRAPRHPPCLLYTAAI